MTFIKPKYRQLAPRISFLSDTAVLAQAWKKSHAYIRRHNWYQNTLELDISAVELPFKLREWRSRLKSGNHEPAKIRLVPAPKNGTWDFHQGWGPASPENLHLRPLAHLTVRDQTVSTAIMLCLADAVETAQGDPSIKDPSDALLAGVFSYGNRLHSAWEKTPFGDRARFPWGNSETYSRYYQDYQRFLTRPIEMARRVSERHSGCNIFVVKIDLTSFFDNINVDALISTLRKEQHAFSRTFSEAKPTKQFWEQASLALQFNWHEEDEQLKSLLKSGALPKGLPQGMVASGFFANAYLLDFDRTVGCAARSKAEIATPKGALLIHDYCRYVDDLRLVISTESSLPDTEIASYSSEWIQRVLNERTDQKFPLFVNEEKTEAEAYSSIGGDSGIAARMSNLQKQLSGPFDLTSLRQVEAGLHGLLALSDRNSPNLPLPDGHHPLQSVASAKTEVRDDTLTRFSAYRLARTLKSRRALTDLDETVGASDARSALTHELEVTARRLIASWAANPSLVPVLLYALDLYPSKKLLEAVTISLLQKVKDRDEKQRYVGWYVLSELLRAGTTSTGKWIELDPGFSPVDLEEYRRALASTALALTRDSATPWYLLQQSSLFCASQGIVVDFLPTDIDELVHHRDLVDVLRGHYVGSAKGRVGYDALAVALVVHQMRSDTGAFVSWFRSYARTQSVAKLQRSLERIGLLSLPLYSAVVEMLADQDKVQHGRPEYLDSYVKATRKVVPELPVDEWVPLVEVVVHPSSPLSQENAILRLAEKLLEAISSSPLDPTQWSPLSVSVKTRDWEGLNNPRMAELSVSVDKGGLRVDPRLKTPSWVRSDCGWAYALGRLLRCAATGEIDFTAGHWLVREQIGWYSGIRSTWRKRLSGMSQAPLALGGTYAGVTQWVSDLLGLLLAWPGTLGAPRVAVELSSVSTVAELLDVIRQRLNHQEEIFGYSSSLPVYIHQVDWNPVNQGKLRVVLLQGLLPSTACFSSGLSGIDTPTYRARHRNHLSSVLHLAQRKIAAVGSASGDRHSPRVDLVIAPEYCVHIEDEDLMRRFSDATGAMVIFGLVSAKHPTSGESVNAARWLIPQRDAAGRTWLQVDQGKQHLTKDEVTLGVATWRPYQVVIELKIGVEPYFRMSGAICYDATDLSLVADLRDISHMFLVCAMNKDIKTFDSMVGALRYHMYQHVLVANSGEFGGSTAQAPYDADHARLISHSHGAQQLAVSIFDVDMDHFGPKLLACQPVPARKDGKDPRLLGKTPPAGLRRG